ncbi:MAG: acyl-CoA dehydrogenase family protein [Methanobacteriota archaeon]
MVDFELTDEQRLMQKVAHEFAEREMRPVSLDYDKKGTVPWDVVQKAHDIQLDTAFIPEAYGGGGVTSTLTHVVVMEELNWGCAGIATGLIGAGLAYLPIIHMGTEDQKKRLLTRFTGPEARLGALCLTEPDAGSDVANLSTTARREADEWVLNGTKRFITNGGIADVHVVFATVDRSLGYFGIRAFAVE